MIIMDNRSFHCAIDEKNDADWNEDFHDDGDVVDDVKNERRSVDLFDMVKGAEGALSTLFMGLG